MNNPFTYRIVRRGGILSLPTFMVCYNDKSFMLYKNCPEEIIIEVVKTCNLAYNLGTGNLIVDEE